MLAAGMLYSPQDTVREQAALTLAVLGWNDQGARAACLHQLCVQSHSGSALQPFALLLRPQVGVESPASMPGCPAHCPAVSRPGAV